MLFVRNQHGSTIRMSDADGGLRRRLRGDDAVGRGRRV